MKRSQIDRDPCGSGDAAEAASFAAAIANFRRLLPDCGFKLVVPPGTCAKATVSVWKRGDDWPVYRSARSPAGALLAVTRDEIEARCARDLLRACDRCRGVGWLTGEDGRRMRCSHRAGSVDHKNNPAPSR